MSAPPYQQGTPAPSAQHDPDPARHLNAPPYPTDRQPGGPPLQSNAADHPNTQQHTVSQNNISDTEGPVLLGGEHRSSAYASQLHSTYESSSPGYHAQAPVTNNLNIDPALLALGQGARQQPPVQQFNMHPGSQVTFAGNAFQQSFGGNAFQQSLITQGNQMMRFEGIEQPTNDADQMDEGAPMFHESTQIFSENNSVLTKLDFDPTMPAYGLGSPLSSYDFEPPAFGLDSFRDKSNDSRVLMPPPPLPSKALAHNIGNKNFQVWTQRDIAHAVGFPDVSRSKFMPNGDDHSVGGTGAIQESSGHSRSSASPAKRRGRSSSDDGRSNVSIDNGDENSHRPPRSTAQRKRVRMSQSSATGSSSESQASSHMSRRESLLVADDSDFKVASGPLQGMSRDEAADLCIKRVDLNVSGADNVDEVKVESEKWIRAIMQAFDDPYNPTPKTKNVDSEKFQQWQKEHHALTTQVFRDDPTNKLAEAIATNLYNQVVASHEKGFLVKSSGNSFRHDVLLNCKGRLENIIKALTGLTIIRYDLVTGARVHELVANPDAVFKRKEENKLENDRKKANKAAADAAKATDKKKPSALTAKNLKAQAASKAKSGNKRVGQGESAVFEESSSGSDDPPDSGALASSTRKVAPHITESKPVNDSEDGGQGELRVVEPAVVATYDDESSSGSDW
ncbi:hypothetical protein Q7P35_000567 [Cladosporium inversicolor]